MKGFEQIGKEQLGDVGNWSLEQCKRYLDEYPNGLKSDSVRIRMAQLGEDKKQTKVKNTNPTRQNDTGNVSAPTASTYSGKSDSFFESKFFEYIGTAFVFVFIIGAAFGLGLLIEYIFGAGAHVKYIVIGIALLLRGVFND